MHTAVVGRSSLLAAAEAVSPKRLLQLCSGIVRGYQAYLIYNSLSAKSDAALARLGLDRRDLPRVAMEAVFEDRHRG